MEHILVVDDSEEIRFLLKTMLDTQGYRVDTANDGQRAIDALQAEAYDLVILDVMMPLKDGYTVLKEMRQAGLRESTRVLMLTAKATDADWARGYSLGVDDYLTKPFEVDELLTSVAKVLSMSKEELHSRREEELDRSRILSRLQSLLGG
jgi:DNA-binding response OmpR family regulator